MKNDSYAISDIRRLPSVQSVSKNGEIVDLTRPEDVEFTNANIYLFDFQKSDFIPITDNAKQISDEAQIINEYDCIAQPISMRLLSDLSFIEPNLRASQALLSAMTAGLGFEFVDKDKYPDKLRETIKRPSINVFDTLYKLVNEFVSDFCQFYNGFISIRKSANGERFYFSRLNARDMYPQPRKRKGVMISGYPKKWAMIPPGSTNPTFYTPYIGQSLDKLKPGHKYVAHLWLGNSKSSFMGIPNYVASLTAVIENVLIRRYGMNFFKNDTRPNFAILITGATFTDPQKSAIKTQLEGYQGVDQKHKTLFIALQTADGRVELKELSSKLEGEFLNERDANSDEIIRTFLLAPKLLGKSAPGSLGSGSENVGSLKVTLEVAVKPIQTLVQDFFNILFSSLYEYENPKMVFNTLDLTSAKDDAIIDNLYSKIFDEDGNAAITPKEIREKNKMGTQNGKPAIIKTGNDTNNQGKPRVGEDTDNSGNKSELQTTEGEDGE